MLSHTYLGVADLARAMTFYSALMQRLGHELKFHDAAEGWAGFMEPGRARPLFLIGRPLEGAASPGNGVMVALLARDRATVDDCHALALAAGGTDEGEPGLRPKYHPHYYGAYVRDPDGNKLCVCCHDPVAGD